ncbi:deoxynucleotidyltransferase terminal-interacting protein 2 [Pristis pectinata]|uniref:deoxynucleotidyltransferase terminal-interacting protein 2 n=1 Tax=Pristis pectinata TaxID=685728 RepID=UPI00223CD8D5|nr:deoxynucleotidyltransferase terminal-interacting protein 2 [Pristis pectinata]
MLETGATDEGSAVRVKGRRLPRSPPWMLPDPPRSSSAPLRRPCRVRFVVTPSGSVRGNPPGVTPSGSGGRGAGGMVQTRSGRRTAVAEAAVSRTRTPVSQRKSKSRRSEANSGSLTESQCNNKEREKEKHVVQAESQPSLVQPAELRFDDQSPKSVVVENKAETEKENLTEVKTYEICIEPIEVNQEKQIVQDELQPSPIQSKELSDKLELDDSESSNIENNADTEKENLTESHEIDNEIDQETNNQENKGGDLDCKTLSETPAVISLLLSSVEDKSTQSDGNCDVLLEESSRDVIPGDSTIPSVTAGSPLEKDSNLFVIDTQPGIDQDRKFYLDSSGKEDSEESEAETGDRGEESEEGEEDDFIDEDEEEEDDILKTKSRLINSSSSIDTGLNLKELGGLYINFNADKGTNSKVIKKLKDQNEKDELLTNSILTPEFEKKHSIPSLKVPERQLKKMRRKERAKTTGESWYNMKAPDLTDELKNDLRVLKMRAAIDPKRFYKKNDRDGFPKYFQVGEVLDNPVDFYHSRLPKKQRKQTMVEELLTDAEFRRYNKRKYQQIMAEKAALAAGKKNRKKKKFKK